MLQCEYNKKKYEKSALHTVFPACVSSNDVLDFLFQQIPSDSADIVLSSYWDGISCAYLMKCCVKIACHTYCTDNFAGLTEINEEIRNFRME